MGLNLLDITCGGITVPSGVAGVIHLIVVLIQVAVPILLIIWGMVDFAKATIGGDEDKIKAGQKIFIKRLIAAILVFLVVTITQLVVGAVASVGGTGNDATNAWSCASQIISGEK